MTEQLNRGRGFLWEQRAAFQRPRSSTSTPPAPEETAQGKGHSTLVLRDRGPLPPWQERRPGRLPLPKAKENSQENHWDTAGPLKAALSHNNEEEEHRVYLPDLNLAVRPWTDHGASLLEFLCL